MIVRAENNRGFSLVELMAVVGIVGVMSAIAFPALNSQLPKWRANGVARDVSGKLMLARLKAIQTNRVHAVDFSLGVGADSDSLSIWRKEESGTWVSAGFGSAAHSAIQIWPAANCDVGGLWRAQFNTNGTAGPCNSIVVQTSDGVWVRKVTISTVTGKITVKYCEIEAC